MRFSRRSARSPMIWVIRKRGFLVIGLQKDGTPLGVKAASLDDEQQAVANRLRSVKLLPTPAFSLEVVNYRNVPLFVIMVDPYPVPPIVTVDGTAWIRSGPTTTRALGLKKLR